MTDKEMHKLSRQDLLSLLVTQGKEFAELREQLELANHDNELLKESNERLRGRISDREKDIEEREEQLSRLKEKLSDKDAKLQGKDIKLTEKDEEIESLKQQLALYHDSKKLSYTSAGSIAEAALRINKVFEAAQAAADQYLYNVKLMAGGDSSDDNQEASQSDEGIDENIDEK